MSASGPVISAKKVPAPGEAGRVVLRAEGLVVRTGGRVLLGPVDFALRAGERVGILGPSGSGKSQFLDRLMGLTPLGRDEGRVVIGSGCGEMAGELVGGAAGAKGEKGAAGPTGKRGEAIGRFPLAAVFQSNALFDILTVRENVGVGAVDEPLAQEVDRVIRSVGLDPEGDGDKFPAELSGGMQRRVAVARALMARPSILVLDEPLVGLDGESRRIVQETVERAFRESGGAMAALVVTHDYDFAATFCDRMGWIDPARRAWVELEDWPGLAIEGRLQRIRSLLRAGDGEEKGATWLLPADTARQEGAKGEKGDKGEKERVREGGAVAGENRRAAGRERVMVGGEKESPVARGRGVVARVVRDQGEQFRDLARSLSGVVGELPALVGGFLHGPGAGARPGRDFLELWLRACVLAVPYVALLFALVGLLMVFQSERLLGPIGLASRIPEAVTLGVVQGFGPLLLALILAGRTGSAMAADLGGQRLSRQVEMWRLLGRDVRVVLFAPRAWALVVAFPLLLLFSEFIALGTGWLFYSVAPETGLTATAFWEGVKESWELGPTLGGMARTALDGALLAAIAYWFGTSPKRGAEDVAEASTRTVVVGSLAFLVVEVAWTMVFGGAG